MMNLNFRASFFEACQDCGKKAPSSRPERRGLVRFIHLDRICELTNRRSEVKVDFSGFNVLSCVMHSRKYF